jgi:hypothetical protein
MSRSLWVTALLAIGCRHPQPAEHLPEVATPVETGHDDAPEELADAPAGTAVLEHQGGCSMAGGQQVHCPATIVAPDPDFIAHGDERIDFDPLTFKCKTDDRTEPCPDALLPHLAPGVEPTRQNGADCALGDVRVACPSI